MFGIGDILSAPFDAVEKLAKGDIGGFFMQPFETAFEADIFFGADLGDVASFVDDVLDEHPWLKTAIVMAAGAATGGVGAVVAAAAIAATDTASEINEGTFELNDLAGGAMEFGTLAASGATGGAVGAMSTAAKVQMGTRILASSGLLGEEASRYVQAAGVAVGGDWSSVMGGVQNTLGAVQQTGALSEDADTIIGAALAATNGDYSSLQSGVTSGIEAASIVASEEVQPYFAGLSSAIDGDYSSFEASAGTIIEVADDTNLLGDDEHYLDGADVALNGQWSSWESGLETAVDVVGETDLLSPGIETALETGSDVATTAASDEESVADYRDVVGL